MPDGCLTCLNCFQVEAVCYTFEATGLYWQWNIWLLKTLFQVVPDVLTTMSQYLDRLEQSFSSRGKYMFWAWWLHTITLLKNLLKYAYILLVSLRSSVRVSAGNVFICDKLIHTLWMLMHMGIWILLLQLHVCAETEMTQIPDGRAVSGTSVGSSTPSGVDTERTRSSPAVLGALVQRVNNLLRGQAGSALAVSLFLAQSRELFAYPVYIGSWINPLTGLVSIILGHWFRLKPKVIQLVL